MDGFAWRKSPIAFIFLVLLAFGTFTGCGGGGGDTTSLSGGGGGDTTGGGGGGDVVSALKATLSGTLLSSSSSGGSSLFKKKMGKAAAATSSLPVSGATVLCFDVDSVSTAAAGSTNTASDGTWTIADVDAGNYVCFGVYLDPTSFTLKTARMDDIAAAAGETVAVPEATVEADTTSPTIVSVLSDNVADTSLSDGDPDPLYEVSDVLPGQAIAVIFSEAMNTTKMAPGTGVILKDSTGTVVSTAMSFNGEGTEFRYTPAAALTPGGTYTLYITNQAKDLSNNGINDPDSDGTVALARITAAESVDPFAYLVSNPSNGDKGVSIYKDLTFSFNRPVDFVSFKDHVTISPAIASKFVPSGDGVTLSHSTPLTAGTTYTVTLGAAIADLGGNTLGAEQSLSFTTGAALNVTDLGFIGNQDDLQAILAGITKAQLALENADLVTFASFFAPTFTMTEIDCSGPGPGPGPGPAPGAGTVAKVAAAGTGPDPMMGSGPSGGCTTTTEDLSTFLESMKKDLIEQRNMSKGFGQTERIPLTSYPTAGAQMSVEHFNSAFDANRTPTGTSLYVGWPMHMEGVDFVNTQIEVRDQWSGTTRTEFATYRLSGACMDGSTPGAGQILASYHFWDPTLNRDTTVTKVCPVYDGDADATNSWASNDEIYPAGMLSDGLTPRPRNLWDDNDGDSMSCPTGNSWDCQNEDGIISFKDTNSDGTPDQAIRYYETVDPSTFMRTPHEDDITAQLSALTVAAALDLAVTNNWDLEGIDNDGDTEIFYFDPANPSNGGWVNRRVNEDWPNGMDDDGDSRTDEDNDGLNANPSPQDIDNDPTNDPMVWNDWNLPNKDSITSNDEFWAQTYLVTDPSIPGAAADPTWTDEQHNLYYVLAGPKGWPYSYAAGIDGRPWSGDEFDQFNNPGDTRNDHAFAWGDVSVRRGSIQGRVFFRSETAGSGITFNDTDRNVYIDLTAAGIVDADGNILTTTNTVSTDPTNTTTRNRISTSEEGTAVYRWNGSGQLSNANGDTIDWQYIRPMMDSIDTNADGDWNPSTQASSGLRRVPHDRNTGGVMAEADYLALGWETWRVSNDLQLIADACPTIDAAGCTSWDVEADWARMEGDDDGDGQFNEDGLYADYFNADGSLKTCASSADYPCMNLDSNTGYLTLHKADGSTLDNDPSTTTVAMFDISDGVDNDFDQEVDEVEPWDDDGDGVSDEDPTGNPSGVCTGSVDMPCDDDDDGRVDEDPVSYERDRLNDHTQWARVYQETTDAVVEMFYLKNSTALNVNDLAIEEPVGTKATAIVDVISTETWTPHNPWGEDYNHDGVPDDVNTWTETMVFDLEKIGAKWLITSITPVENFKAYQDMVEGGQIQQFGPAVPKIFLVSPVGDPLTGPPANVGLAPTFQWDDSDVTGTVGSFLIHIEEISETMVTGGGSPTSVMMILVDPSCVPADANGVRSYTLGDACGTDVTSSVIDGMGSDPNFPFTTALTALEDGKAYGWGVLAFADATLDFSTGKPEPVGDSFEPRMFATGALPAFMAAPALPSTTTGTPKAKIGGKLYHPIPSNIAPNFYGR